MTDFPPLKVLQFCDCCGTYDDDLVVAVDFKHAQTAVVCPQCLKEETYETALGNEAPIFKSTVGKHKPQLL